MFNSRGDNLARGANWKPSAALKKRPGARPSRTLRVSVYVAALAIAVGTYDFIGLWRDPALRSIRPALQLTSAVVIFLVVLWVARPLVRRKPQEPDKKSLLQL
jgi:hypothetical protein